MPELAARKCTESPSDSDSSYGNSVLYTSTSSSSSCSDAIIHQLGEDRNPPGSPPPSSPSSSSSGEGGPLSDDEADQSSHDSDPSSPSSPSSSDDDREPFQLNPPGMGDVLQFAEECTKLDAMAAIIAHSMRHKSDYVGTINLFTTLNAIFGRRYFPCTVRKMWRDLN